MARKRKRIQRSKARSKARRPAWGRLPRNCPRRHRSSCGRLASTSAPTATAQPGGCRRCAPGALDVGLRASENLDVSGGPPPNAVIYIHGIGNKPPAWCSSVNGTWHCSTMRSAIAAAWPIGSTRNTTRSPPGQTCAAGDVVDTGRARVATRSIMGIAERVLCRRRLGRRNSGARPGRSSPPA